MLVAEGEVEFLLLYFGVFAFVQSRGVEKNNGILYKINLILSLSLLKFFLNY